MSKNVELAVAATTSVWQDLYVFINRTYDKTRLTNMRKLAGGEYYQAAASNNRKALDTMLTMGSAFITRHKDELKNSGNMPDTFPNIFNATRAAYEAASAK